MQCCTAIKSKVLMHKQRLLDFHKSQDLPVDYNSETFMAQNQLSPDDLEILRQLEALYDDACHELETHLKMPHPAFR